MDELAKNHNKEIDELRRRITIIATPNNNNDYVGRTLSHVSTLSSPTVDSTYSNSKGGVTMVVEDGDVIIGERIVMAEETIHGGLAAVKETLIKCPDSETTTPKNGINCNNGLGIGNNETGIDICESPSHVINGDCAASIIQRYARRFLAHRIYTKMKHDAQNVSYRRIDIDDIGAWARSSTHLYSMSDNNSRDGKTGDD